MPRLSEIPEEKLKAIYDLALDHIKESTMTTQVKVDKCVRWYEAYRKFGQLPPSLLRKNRSNLMFNVIYPIIETINPIEVAAILSQNPPIWVQPNGRLDTDSADHAEKILGYFQRESGKGIFMDLLEWDKVKCLYGVGVMKTGWVSHFKKVKQEIPQYSLTGEIVGIETAKYDVMTYEGLFHRVVEPGNIIISPGATDFMENGRACDFCGDKSFYTDSYLKALQRGAYLENIDEILKRGKRGLDKWHTDKLNKIGLGSMDKKSSKYNELIELWLWFDIDGDGQDEYLQVILVNRQYPMAKVDTDVYDHNEPPYVRLPHTVDVNNFWGIGAVEPLESYQVENNVNRNNLIDNSNLTNNQMFKRRSNIRPDQIPFGAGASVEVLESSDLEPIIVPPMNMDVDRRYQMILRDIENMSGVSAWRRGTQKLGTSTAFEASLMEAGANAVAQLPIMITSEYALPRLAQLDLSNIDQFSSAVVEFKLTDEPPTFFVSAPEDRDGISKIKYNFICTGHNQFINKNIRIQQLLMATKEFFNLPLAMQLINPYEHLKRIYMLMFPQDWNNLLVNPDEMQLAQDKLGALAGMGGGTEAMPEAGNESEILRNTMRNIRPDTGQ